MKLKEKIKAKKLRRLGKSYSEIHKQIKVSKSTLSLWLRDIVLTAEQKKRIYVKLIQKNAYRLAKLNQKKRIENTKRVIKGARREFPLHFKNPLFLSGLMLYWAEGEKGDIYEKVHFCNSDPEMIKFMMRWFRTICKVSEDKFRIGLHIHSLHCRKNIEDYWSGLTNVQRSQFHKTYVKVTSLGYRKNLLYNGTCSIKIFDKDLFRKIKGWRLEFIKRMNKKTR